MYKYINLFYYKKFSLFYCANLTFESLKNYLKSYIFKEKT